MFYHLKCEQKTINLSLSLFFGKNFSCMPESLFYVRRVFFIKQAACNVVITRDSNNFYSVRVFHKTINLQGKLHKNTVFQGIELTEENKE